MCRLEYSEIQNAAELGVSLVLIKSKKEGDTRSGVVENDRFGDCDRENEAKRVQWNDGRLGNREWYDGYDGVGAQ